MPRDRAYEEMRPSGTGYDQVDPRHHYVRMDELEAKPRKPPSKKKKKRPKPKHRSPDRFPALIHMTGEGYLREIPANETIDDLLSIP
ncbi:hypothetical protein TELCIR_09445 [Teladorsagia circumcincta]|uniref:Uncharacterized protein n=1 Tax=Teladorsagia circumcincta TaxID=45464 RepID=A0A2G9UEU4_TELCI|nr:hypothetical protein TELCIR_09445 [Teladorsagia circumcincta]